MRSQDDISDVSVQCRLPVNPGRIDRHALLRHQKGSISVTAVLFASVAVLLLASTFVGYWFYLQRDFQKTADLAALSGAQYLTASATADECSSAASAAQAIAASNASGVTAAVSCGQWSSENPAPFFVDGAANPNAVKVQASGSPTLSFLSLAPHFNATAIAANTPVAAFSIGTNIISLCTSESPVLQALVTGLLKSNICISSGNAGLLNTQISLLDFQKALLSAGVNVGTVDQLLAAKVSVATFVNAVVSALSTNQVAAADISALNTDLAPLMTGPLANQLITIGNVLNLTAADKTSALNATVNVLNLLSVGTLQVANTNHFIVLDARANVGVASAAISLSLIEPPQIAVGGPGTKATSAQVRLFVDVKGLRILGTLLADIPIYIDVAPGTATLEQLSCVAPQSATFSATTGLGEVCAASTESQTSTPFSCPNVTQTQNQVSIISLLSINAIGLGINAPLVSNSVSETLTAPLPQSVNISSSLSQVLSNAITPTTIAASILNNIPLVGPLLNSLLSGVLSGVTGLLGPVLGGVGSLLDPVLQALGIGFGSSTLQLTSINCSNLSLVQ